jgi:peptidoglycan DL-endopeptidase CwlO
MYTRSLSRVGAIAVVSTFSISGCTQATLGVSPETVLSAVLSSIPSSNGPSPGGGTSRGRRIPPSPPPSSRAVRVLHTADSYVGVKYVWGGNTPSEGFDCSGFTRYVFAKYGIALPRTSREQVHSGAAVTPDFRDLHPGDLVFFAGPGEAISHVAIYAGDGVIIHASSSVGGVGYTDLNRGGDWFVAYLVAARRVL